MTRRHGRALVLTIALIGCLAVWWWVAKLAWDVISGALGQ